MSRSRSRWLCASTLVLVSVSLVLARARLDRAPAADRAAHGPGAAPVPGSTPMGALRDQAIEEALDGLVFGTEKVSIAPGWGASFEDAEAFRRWLSTGHAHLEAGRRVPALEAFTHAVSSVPGDIAGYTGLARALVANRQTERARSVLWTAIGLAPDDLSLRMALGRVLERSGLRDRARAAYAFVVDRAPEHGPAHARLAVLHYLDGHPDKASTHLRVARFAGAPVPEQLAARIRGVPGVRAEVRPSSGSARGVTLGPPIRLDVGAGTGWSTETTAVALSGGAGTLIAGWNDTRDPFIGTGFAISVDGGASWTDQLVRPPALNQGQGQGDPMTAVDPRTGTMWVGGFSFIGDQAGVYVARKQAGAVAFEPAIMTSVGGGADKGWMAAGRPPSTPDATHVYVAFNLGLQTSADFGDTWSDPLPLGNGAGQLPRIGPAGEVYISYWDFADGILFRSSLDGGASVGPAVTAALRAEALDDQGGYVPGLFRVLPFHTMAVDPTNGRLVIAWADAVSVVDGETDVDLHLVTSDDSGATWSVPMVVPRAGDQFFPWLEIDATGRLHVVFLDTRNTPQSDADPVALLDAYYASSVDGGQSWDEIRLTSAPWSSAPPVGGFDFLGDYLGLALRGDRAFPIYLAKGGDDRVHVFTREIVPGDPAVFADGFASGDTSAWTFAVP